MAVTVPPKVDRVMCVRCLVQLQHMHWVVQWGYAAEVFDILQQLWLCAVCPVLL